MRSAKHLCGDGIGICFVRIRLLTDPDWAVSLR